MQDLEPDRRTIMHSFADRLQGLHVNCGSASVITIVLVLFISHDAVCTLQRRESQGCPTGYPWNYTSNVERVYRRVRVHFVRIKDCRVCDGLEDGSWELRCGRERVFIWTVIQSFTISTHCTGVEPIPREPPGFRYCLRMSNHVLPDTTTWLTLERLGFLQEPL